MAVELEKLLLKYEKAEHLQIHTSEIKNNHSTFTFIARWHAKPVKWRKYFYGLPKITDKGTNSSQTIEEIKITRIVSPLATPKLSDTPVVLVRKFNLLVNRMKTYFIFLKVDW